MIILTIFMLSVKMALLVWIISTFNPLKPYEKYTGHTAPLTSKRCILYIYSRNIDTGYFKHGICSPFFSSKCSFFHNSNVFGSCIIHILYTGCAKIKKNNSGAKRLNSLKRTQVCQVHFLLLFLYIYSPYVNNIKDPCALWPYASARPKLKTIPVPFAVSFTATQEP